MQVPPFISRPRCLLSQASEVCISTIFHCRPLTVLLHAGYGKSYTMLFVYIQITVTKENMRALYRFVMSQWYICSSLYSDLRKQNCRGNTSLNKNNWWFIHLVDTIQNTSTKRICWMNFSMQKQTLPKKINSMCLCWIDNYHEEKNAKKLQKNKQTCTVTRKQVLVYSVFCNLDDTA